MLKFIIGVFVGAIIGFAICAICSMADTDDRTDEPCTKKLGDSDAGK